MTSKVTIELSKDAGDYLEERAREAGLKSASDCVETPVREDQDLFANREWLKRRLEEGLASPIVGELTRERLHEWVQEGIARAQKRK